ncbi:hypothetical protein V1506DRAFT_131998 [Lipomyces tetrasporus]
MSQKKICAKDLGIDLESGQETEYFKWFLACLLFGKPVQQEVAKQTYLELVQDRITSPEAILNAGWDKLVNQITRGFKRAQGRILHFWRSVEPVQNDR